MKFNIRVLYLYLFSFVGLLITVIGLIRIVDLGMKVYVFNNADVYEDVYPATKLARDEDMGMVVDEEKMRQTRLEEAKRNRKRELSSSLSMIIVGTPLYYYHWKTIKKEKA